MKKNKLGKLVMYGWVASIPLLFGGVAMHHATNISMQIAGDVCTAIGFVLIVTAGYAYTFVL